MTYESITCTLAGSGVVVAFDVPWTEDDDYDDTDLVFDLFDRTVGA